jgi:hypothetical protein
VGKKIMISTTNSSLVFLSVVYSFLVWLVGTGACREQDVPMMLE